MSVDLDVLFDEFAAAFARGEHPDALSYVDRAGADSDALARMIESFLASAPGQPADEETTAKLNALVLAHPPYVEEPPLLEARLEAGKRRAELVDALVRLLGLAPALRDRVAERYHQLETGQLDPDRVDGRVWGVIEGILGRDVRNLAAFQGAEMFSFDAMYRRAETSASGQAVTPSAAPAVEPEPGFDQVDRLFGVGPEP